MDAGLYCLIVAVFVVLRIGALEKLRHTCGEKLYTPPVKTYLWQIVGMAVIFVMVSGLMHLSTWLEIQAYMPRVCFVALLGLLAGFCAFSIVLFAFTPVGLYTNGLLTHYMFLEYGEIESYELINANMLNMGRETKTLSFTIKNNTSNHPSFEYPVKEEEKIKEILQGLGIPQTTAEN